jgi:hypothetical protein
MTRNRRPKEVARSSLVPPCPWRRKSCAISGRSPFTARAIPRCEGGVGKKRLSVGCRHRAELLPWPPAPAMAIHCAPDTPRTFLVDGGDLGGELGVNGADSHSCPGRDVTDGGCRTAVCRELFGGIRVCSAGRFVDRDLHRDPDRCSHGTKPLLAKGTLFRNLTTTGRPSRAAGPFARTEAA